MFEQLLVAPDRYIFDSRFGASVAVQGDRIAVLAPAEWSDTGMMRVSSIYVFERNGGRWTSTAIINLPTALKSFDLNGRYALAMSGDAIVVGDELADFGGQFGVGAVHVFTKSGNSWSQGVTLNLGADAAQNDNFGESVALSGNVLLVGVPNRTAAIGGTAIAGNGAVIVYERSGIGVWTRSAVLSASASQRFGTRVRVSGNTALVAGRSLYVFVRGSSWMQQANLVSTSVVSPGGIGTAYDIGLDGDMAVAGYYALVAGTTEYGILVFARDANGSWGELPRPPPQTTYSESRFASSLAVSGSDILVASHFSTVRGKDAQGQARVYRRSANGVIQELLPILDSNDSTRVGLYGAAVARSATRLAIASAGWDGGVRVYRALGDGHWTLEDTVWARELGAVEDDFGIGLVLSDEELAVSAPNGTYDAGSGGAVFLLSRRGNNWELSSRAILDAGQGDLFGRSMARAGNTLVAGALRANGQRGRVEVFDVVGGVLRFRQTITGPPVGVYGFGTSVSVSDDTLLVGSPNEEISAPMNSFGAVYVFGLDGGLFTQVDRWSAPPQACRFGSTIVVDGTTAFVGAPTLSDYWFGGSGCNTDTGTLTIFARNAQKVWSSVGAVVAPSNPSFAENYFGAALWLRGDDGLVGSPAWGGSGAVFRLKRMAGGIWSVGPALTPFDYPAPHGIWRPFWAYGSSVSAWGDEVVVGAPRWTGIGPYATPEIGAVYLP